MVSPDQKEAAAEITIPSLHSHKEAICCHQIMQDCDSTVVAENNDRKKKKKFRQQWESGGWNKPNSNARN